MKKHQFHLSSVLATLLVSFAALSNAHADVLQSSGAGSAVTTVSASADFESVAALNDNPYVENGLSFSRTNLSFDNNTCGFAGCGGAFPANFSGNYMYGVGTGGFFTMSAASGTAFKGLEFVAGSGFGNGTNVNFVWQTFSAGVMTGSGSGTTATGTVLGFSDAAGFDQLNWTESSGSTDLTGSLNAPAFDSVRVELTSAVPEPESFAMLLAGLGLLGLMARRRKAA